MTNSRRENNLQWRDLVTEARAGLIPECDDKEDEIQGRMKRTARVVRILKVHAGLPTCGSEEQAVTDLIADLRHYCQQAGLSFRRLDRAGYALYLEEKTGRRYPHGDVTFPKPVAGPPVK
jgi:hypothetical protein